MIHRPEPTAQEPPFIAVVRYEPEGHERFTPRCRIELGASLRQLARDLPADQFKELTAIMGFVTANGRVAPSTPDLAGVLGLPVWLMRSRLIRLERAYWHGQPLVRRLRQPSGRETFQPSTAVLGLRELFPVSAMLPSIAPAGREAVIAASRKRYARPRKDAEEEIMARQGWPSPEEREAERQTLPQSPTEISEVWAVERLAKAGVAYSLAIKLVRDFGADRCIRQAQWLPYRAVKDAARYLVAAIQGDYVAPVGAPSYNPTTSESSDRN